MDASWASAVATSVQVVSVVTGVVISVLSFNDARAKEAQAREDMQKREAQAREKDAQAHRDAQEREDLVREIEANARKLEAAKPFLQLRLERYSQVIQAAGVLTNPEVHSAEEMAEARKRFRQLYVAELSMVEAHGVEKKMVALAEAIDPSLVPLNGTQAAAYKLAHSLRESFLQSWGITEADVNRSSPS